MEVRTLIAYLLMALVVAAGAFVWRHSARKRRERRGHTHRARHKSRPNKRA